MAAWGAKGDLFAREAAEEVTDASLMAEPLAHPGEVIRKPRGSFESVAVATAPKPSRKEPSRAALDKAEAALADFEKRAAAELASMRERVEALARERADLEKRQHAEREKLVKRRDRKQEKYAQAVATTG